ncbi:caspase activity and apoptosis inhibitor 1 isoform X2 [Gouania willdenowi]|uniref:Caspase activity and apoptosis inhibitor 1 n=1 Tax=Gouania willdenowi TaxID=441366 RepID=A0A8C5GE76_GOUWI|nr:caspase activity and apoptosis inhibitor 1 isoform X1 [Gouania willdenowi]XP_028330588.1 caspase activity and apoptosis inhibitor 1 isoform X2 [Gouania willdenowi]
MLKRKSRSSEKKRKHSVPEDRRDGRKRRSAECKPEEPKDELADTELDRISSDIEEGGLDLSVAFKPITAYVGDKQELLEQCFQVLGEKKLRRMLPDEFKDCSLQEIKTLCCEQLMPIPEKNLIQILTGDELCDGKGNNNSESQQDNNIDSTSCLKDTAKTEQPKQEEGGSGEESDVLSINADTYDSDIEGPKDDQTVKAADVAEKLAKKQTAAKAEPKKDIQSDIDKSVKEILALSSSSSKDVENSSSVPPQPTQVASPAANAPSGSASSVSQPSIQQLELLELEMRARAIKALMKASNGKMLSTRKSP